MACSKCSKHLGQNGKKAVLGYATGTKNKTQGLCCALKDLNPASDPESEDEEEHTSYPKFMQSILLYSCL